MAVKLIIAQTDFDALPEALQKEYKPVAGKTDEFELDVDGGNPSARLKEFRDRNIQLDKKVKELETAWDGLRPDEVREVMAKADDIKKGEVFKKGSAEFDKEIEKRTNSMKLDLEQKARAAEEKAASLQGRLEKLEIDEALVREATALNVLPEALNDFVGAHRSLIKLVNGVPVVYEADGKTEVYGEDTRPITIKEHCAKLAKSKPWFFKPSKGAGTTGTGAEDRGGGDDSENPFKAGPGFSKTKQQAMLGSDDPAVRAKAARLKAAAGAS
jgi:hypothetical protein